MLFSRLSTRWRCGGSSSFFLAAIHAAQFQYRHAGTSAGSQWDDEHEVQATAKESTTIDWCDKPPPPGVLQTSSPRPEGSSSSSGSNSAAPPVSLLREKERVTFLNALLKRKLEIDTRKRKKGSPSSDGATAPPSTTDSLRYQAQNEIQWLEEWASQQLLPAGGGEDAVQQRRRLLKRSLLEHIEFKKPLPYILGFQPFFGCHIQCRAPVACPQSETEMWTHWLIHRYGEALKGEKGAAGDPPIFRVLDMCCGTGCVGIAIGKHFKQMMPRQKVQVVAVDLNKEAAKLSAENAILNGLLAASSLEGVKNGEGEYLALEGDMFSALSSSASAGPLSFDLVVCNPPYLMPHEGDDINHYVDRSALFGDPSRCGAEQYRYFKELCEEGCRLLKPRCAREGKLGSLPNMIVEVGSQAELVASLMERATKSSEGGQLWSDVELHLDFNQQPRWISANSSH